MSGFALNAIVSYFKQVIPAVTLALLMVPSSACAELVMQLHDEWGRLPVPETPRQKVKRPMVFCLNGTGELFVRHRDVSLSMAYTPVNDNVEPQERLRITERQDCPTINGISLKLSLQF